MLIFAQGDAPRWGRGSGGARWAHVPRGRGAAMGVLLLAFLLLAALSLAAANNVVDRASDLLEWGRWKEARALMQQAVAAPATANAPVMAYYSHVLTGFGDTAAAVTWAQKSVNQDPDCVICHLFLAEALGTRAKTLGDVKALIEVRKVRRELEHAEQIDPGDGDVMWGWLHFELELPPIAGGSIGTAAQYAEKLARIDPVEGELGRAAVALAQNQKAKALAYYERAAAEAPDDPRGSFDAGRTLYQEGEYAAAEPYLERASHLQNQSPLYTGYQAANLVRLNRTAEARKLLGEAESIFPDSRLPDFLVAQALIAGRQDVPWARELLKDYLAVPPEPDQPSQDEAQNLLNSTDPPA